MPPGIPASFRLGNAAAFAAPAVLGMLLQIRAPVLMEELVADGTVSHPPLQPVRVGRGQIPCGVVKPWPSALSAALAPHQWRQHRQQQRHRALHARTAGVRRRLVGSSRPPLASRGTRGIRTEPRNHRMNCAGGGTATPSPVQLPRCSSSARSEEFLPAGPGAFDGPVPRHLYGHATRCYGSTYHVLNGARRSGHLCDEMQASFGGAASCRCRCGDGDGGSCAAGRFSESRAAGGG